MDKILISEKKVRFQDCDPFNHLNNAKYLDYFLNAREDQLLESYNFDIFDIAINKSLGWVIYSNQILYLNPVFTMETIVIETQLTTFTYKSLTVEMRMLDINRRKLKSILWTSFIHFDLKLQKPINHQDEYLQLFENVVLPIDQKTIEERRNFLLRDLAREQAKDAQILYPKDEFYK